MGFFDRLFGKKRATTASTAADQARSRQMAGRETGQTTDEQAATRGRMEAEMAGQRQGRADAAAAAATATATADGVPPCPHTALTPRWDSVADMGNTEKVTSYTCQGCHQEFTPAAGRTLLATEAERLRRDLSTEP
jgi:hypothetical protein